MAGLGPGWVFPRYMAELQIKRLRFGDFGYLRTAEESCVWTCEEGQEEVGPKPLQGSQLCWVTLDPLFWI